MKSQRATLSRRVVLGAILNSAPMTQLALGQTTQHAAPSQEKTSMKIRIVFNGQTMTATLYDNPSAARLCLHAAARPYDRQLLDQ
jgi:hypothetical protein